jgi:gamma-glutamylcysteine synthetase
MELNGRAVDVNSLTVMGVDYKDYPDFADAYFDSACWEDGTALNDTELTHLTEDYTETVMEMAFHSGIV